MAATTATGDAAGGAGAGAAGAAAAPADGGGELGVAPHNFKLHHFNKFTWCDFCSKFIWGVGIPQGYKCKACDYAVHRGCSKVVPPRCSQRAIVRSASEKRAIVRHAYADAAELVAAMRAPQSGLVVKARKVRLRSVPLCFVGSEAVDWLLGHVALRDRGEAVAMLDALRVGGALEAADGGAKKKFKDKKDAFFRFIDGAVVPREKDPLVAAAGGDGAGAGAAAAADTVTLDDFEELKVIGRGGFGQVLKVKRKGSTDGKLYAMKVMNKNKITGERQLQCLIVEKNVMLNDNPFLVHLHYSFQTTDQLFFVMDYIPGGDLAFHLEQRGQFNDKEVRFLTAEIVLALEHLHSCGIIYRDLKLENILIDGGGHVCLTDFGLSKELDEVAGSTKTVCGTPTYLAPEILLGQDYTNAIDWWSLGVVMFELFTGMNPFDAADFDAVLNNILHSTIILPESIPREGRDLMEALLQRDPLKRMCSSERGGAEIQEHDFFKGLDWDDLMVKRIKSPIKIKEEEEYFDPLLNEDPEGPPEGRGDANQLIGDFTYVPGSAKPKAAAAAAPPPGGAGAAAGTGGAGPAATPAPAPAPTPALAGSVAAAR